MKLKNSENQKKYFFKFFLFIFFMTFPFLEGEEVRVILEGEEILLELSDHHTFGQIKKSIQSYGKKSENFILAMRSKEYAASIRGAYLGYPRDYYLEVSSEEKANIHFIITSLASKSLVSLAKAKVRNDLELAGDQIDHIHPLRFLYAIFTDETLKVGIKNMRSRGWIWGSFIDGLKNSLNSEADIGNITEEHIENFARGIKIDPQLILSLIEQRKWEAFIDTTIRNVPRLEVSDRYD